MDRLYLPFLYKGKMKTYNSILHPPEGLQAIYGFYYRKNQIVLLYSTSSREDSWIEIYKENHFDNNDIIDWCQSHRICYQLLDKKCSKVYKQFMNEMLNREL